MPPAERTCPFCNADLAGVVRDTRAAPIPCPRCGEPLPLALCQQLPSTPAPAANGADPAPAPVPGKTKTVLCILAIMAVMAAVAGVYTWNTQGLRRQNDFRTQKKTEPKPLAAADVPILGFLPARCNVLAAVQVGELLRQPATRKLLEEPPLAAALGQLQQWTGLKLVDIEQIVVGAEIKSTLPQVMILVQTRQPYAQGKITAALAPARAAQHRNKTLIRFPLQPAGQGLLWCHSERLLVFVLALDAALTDDLDALPPQPRLGTEGFAAPLRAALTQRLPSASSLWLAGHFEEPSPVGELVGMALGKNADLATLLRTKTLVVSLQAQESPTLTGHFFTGDAKATARLQALLEARRGPETTSYKVAGPPPDQTEPDVQWVTLQARGDLAKILTAWQKR